MMNETEQSQVRAAYYAAMARAEQPVAVAFDRLMETEQWIDDHGETEAGYVERYGADGKAIYAADMAEASKAYDAYIAAVISTR